MKRILFDVDGVAADFVGAYRTAAEYVTKRQMPEVPDQWEVAKAYQLLPSEIAAVNTLLEAPGTVAGLSPLPDAVEAITDIARLNDVWFVTAYSDSHPTWTYERSLWLKQHFGPVLGARVVHTHHKHLVPGDILVDDKPSNCEAWQLAWPKGKALLWSALYNDDAPDHLVRAYSWWQVRGVCAQ